MSQIWDIYCKHCLWSIFGPCWCTKSCKTTFYAHLSRIWKFLRQKSCYPESFCFLWLWISRFDIDLYSLILMTISHRVTWSLSSCLTVKDLNSLLGFPQTTFSPQPPGMCLTHIQKVYRATTIALLCPLVSFISSDHDVECWPISLILILLPGWLMMRARPLQQVLRT